MRIANVLAPAKLNLFLHVTGVRPDGYHLLESAFVRIDWCDVLDFELLESPEIRRSDLTVSLPDRDLTVQAASLLQAASGGTRGVHIRIAKHIPSQAGLGGGSSDAAATLLTLNRLWGLYWPLERLQPLALQLGADVPFFVGARHAWVQGIGEQLTPLQGRVALPNCRFLVVKPPGGASTAEIFSHPLLESKNHSARIADFASEPLSFGRNDLQAAAMQVCPDIERAVEWLSKRGFCARMSGSGSAVFAAVDEGAAAVDMEAVLRDVPQGWQARVCSLLEDGTA